MHGTETNSGQEEKQGQRGKKKGTIETVGSGPPSSFESFDHMTEYVLISTPRYYPERSPDEKGQTNSRRFEDA
jgi:hypothetical protein